MRTIKPHWKSIRAWQYGITMTSISGIIHYVYALMKANHGSMVRGLLPKTCRSIFDAFVIDSLGVCACDYVVLYVIEKTKLAAPCIWNGSYHIATSIEVDVLNVCLSKYARRMTFETRRSSRRVFRHPFARNRRDWINSSLRPDILGDEDVCANLVYLTLACSRFVLRINLRYLIIN